jgi:hypothetical protein
VIADAYHMLLAGCAIAAATGGSWDGPDFFTCPSGQAGTLQYVNFGSPFSPATTNPTLMGAFQDVSFGPVISSLVATGTGKPIFTYVPYGNIRLAPAPQFVATCTLGNGLEWKGGEKCPAVPENVTSFSGAQYWGWNWSNNQSQNSMYLGDSWSVSFWVVADGPPYATVPVDACITVECRAAGSTSVGGVYSWATYIPATNSSVVTSSFPLATVQVVQTPTPAPAAVTPPIAPPPPPGLFIPIQAPVAVQTPVGVSAQVPIIEVALQATAVGFLVGAAIRVQQRNRPMTVVNLAGKPKHIRSRFDSEAGGNGAGVGRFE